MKQLLDKIHFRIVRSLWYRRITKICEGLYYYFTTGYFSGANTIGFYISNKKLYYITIPKNLSSSIKKMMLEIHQLPTHNLVHRRHNRFMVLEKPKDTEFSFCIVRNPFAKLVSCYNNQYSNRSYGVFDDYLFGIPLGRKKVKNFSDFVHKITKIPEKCTDIHLVSQCTFLMRREEKRREESPSCGFYR